MTDVIVVIDQNPTAIVVDDQQPANINVDDVNIFIEEGPGSSSGILTFIAGENLQLGNLVYMVAGKVYKFNPSNISLYGKHLGFTMADVVTDQAVRIKQLGIQVKTAWGLIPDTTYYALENGLIGTSLTATEKIILPVGVAMSANMLYINFGTFYIIN